MDNLIIMMLGRHAEVLARGGTRKQVERAYRRALIVAREASCSRAYVIAVAADADYRERNGI